MRIKNKYYRNKNRKEKYRNKVLDRKGTATREYSYPYSFFYHTYSLEEQKANSKEWIEKIFVKLDKGSHGYPHAPKWFTSRYHKKDRMITKLNNRKIVKGLDPLDDMVYPVNHKHAASYDWL